MTRHPRRRLGALLASTASAVGRVLGRRAAKPPLGDPPAEPQGSPGQFGFGATRDLTRSELQEMRPSYAPQLDHAPDPGEIVWTWVPYVENDGRGKDRPVLIIARLRDGVWAACALSTTPHAGFVSVGSGPWDSKGRESFLSPERVLRVTEAGMRRESAALDRARFAHAVSVVRSHHRLA